MPTISEKGEMMPASPIRKLVPYAEAVKKKGRKVYHLNIGQPDIATPEIMLNAIHHYHDPVIEYSHSAGNISYRKKLTEYYNRYNIQLTPEDIIITTGGSEAILFAFQCCLNPGDEIIIPEPFYANYIGFAINAGIKIVPIPSTIESGFSLPPIADFEKVISSKTKGIMVCNPNNPTGYLYSKAELETLRDLALKYDIYLFADEVYREFCYDGKSHFSVMQLEGLEEHAILFDSVSKRYSACGVRVGCLISKNKKVMTAALKFAQARLSPPSLGQVAAEAAIDTPESYFTDVVKEYTLRRNIVIDAVNKMEGAFCPKPMGAFYVVARLPIDNCDTFCRWLLEDFEYNNQTVMMAPASGFYSNPKFGTDEVRISYVLKAEDLHAAMEVLAMALKQYPGRKI